MTGARVRVRLPAPLNTQAGLLASDDPAPTCRLLRGLRWAANNSRFAIGDNLVEHPAVSSRWIAGSIIAIRSVEPPGLDVPRRKCYAPRQLRLRESWSNRAVIRSERFLLRSSFRRANTIGIHPPTDAVDLRIAILDYGTIGPIPRIKLVTVPAR